jgi:hypothetical protein
LKKGGVDYVVRGMKKFSHESHESHERHENKNKNCPPLSFFYGAACLGPMKKKVREKNKKRKIV